MMKNTNSILLVSADDSLNEIFSTLPYFNTIFQVCPTSGLEEAFSYLQKCCTEETLSPHIILLNFDDLLNDGIKFLEGYAKTGLPKRDNQRIIFLTNDHNASQVSIIRALGDFEFINAPVTEEKLFNCLAGQLVFS